MQEPNYDTARSKAGFDWAASGSQDSLRTVAGIPIREFNLNPSACIEAYRKGRPSINSTGAGLADDMASMIPPSLWPEFVLPYWEQYYTGLTTGTRGARVEDLRPAQAPYLETIGLSSYDPSISPQLNPKIIAAQCRVPFTWRLGSFHYRNLSHADIENFVFQLAADGATGTFTNAEALLCNPADVAKMHTFIRAAKEAKAMLAAGASRAEAGRRVNPQGRVKFWEGWTGFKG